MDIKGKNILITGSSRGIGLSLAKKAATLNMNIHLLNRTQDQSIEQELINLGAKSVQFWKIDLSQAKSIDSFVADFKTKGINPDILVNNAGLLTGGLLEDQETEKIYEMLQVNLTGLIHLTKKLLPIMLKLKEAKIVNNSSVSGIMFLPCASTYAASKAGVIAFTESLRNELVGTKVSTLVMVTPGVKTRMYDEISDLYAGNMDLKFLTSIPASQWADRVFDHIVKDKNVCLPTGNSFFGVKLGQHMPRLLSKIVSPYFKRN